MGLFLTKGIIRIKCGNNKERTEGNEKDEIGIFCEQ
jgi:hypothetical protein